MDLLNGLRLLGTWKCHHCEHVLGQHIAGGRLLMGRRKEQAVVSLPVMRTCRRCGTLNLLEALEAERR